MGLDQWCVGASRIYVLLCFRYTTEFTQGGADSWVKGSAHCQICQSNKCLERLPICRGDLCVALVSVTNREVQYRNHRVGSLA